MSCEDLRESLHELVEGTLSPPAEARLRTQLNTRPECQDLLRSLQALQEALPAWTTPPPSPDFVWKVYQKLALDEAAAKEEIRSPKPNRTKPASIPSSSADLDHEGEGFFAQLFRRRLTIPVPLGTAALALFLLSALFNLRTLTREEGSPGEAGPGSSNFIDVGERNNTYDDPSAPGTGVPPQTPGTKDDPNSAAGEVDLKAPDGRDETTSGRLNLDSGTPANPVLLLETEKNPEPSPKKTDDSHP